MNNTSLRPSDANMRLDIFWCQIWIPLEDEWLHDYDLIIISYNSQQGKLQLQLELALLAAEPHSH